MINLTYCSFKSNTHLMGKCMKLKKNSDKKNNAVKKKKKKEIKQIIYCTNLNTVYMVRSLVWLSSVY